MTAQNRDHTAGILALSILSYFIFFPEFTNQTFPQMYR